MSKMPFGTYDPEKVDVVFNGTPIDGFGAGTFIKVSRNEDGWTFQPSNSGGGARSRNPNRSGTIEFTLHTASPANGYLSAYAVADELSGSGVGEFYVTDRSSLATECSAQNAWIKKFPDWEKAKETGEVTWVLEADDINMAFGGIVPNT